MLATSAPSPVVLRSLVFRQRAKARLARRTSDRLLSAMESDPGAIRPAMLRRALGLRALAREAGAAADALAAHLDPAFLVAARSPVAFA